MDYLKTKLFEKKGFWSKADPYSDIVLSTRIRLIRNIYSIPYPNKQKKIHSDFIKSTAARFVSESDYKYLELIDLDTIDDANKRYLIEENLINHSMAESGNSFLILSRNDDFNIMVNNKDHFRIQIIKPGFQAFDAYYFADDIDNNLNRFAIYAFSEDLGYITTSLPYNISFKASAMMHLPALALSKGLSELQEYVRLNGFNITGLRENGLKTLGSIYIISNNFIPDAPEKKILNILEKIVYKTINSESEMREIYFSENSRALEDRICRSFGLLRYARKLGYAESMDFLSDIRLGIILSIVKNIELSKINELMLNSQWSHLQRITNRVFKNSFEGDACRAGYLRDQLESTTINNKG